MAQARRAQSQRARQGGAGQGLPGWAMLTIGLIIGLFVAFLVYLDDLEPRPNAAVRADPEQAADAAGDTGGGTSDGPRFQFYSILPELEVVVPGLDQSSSDGGAESDGGADAPADSGDDAARRFAEGRYHIQAGSFQQADQADSMKARLTLLGLKVHIQKVRLDGQLWHRVRIGPFTKADALREAVARLREHDIEYLILRDRAG